MVKVTTWLNAKDSIQQMGGGGQLVNFPNWTDNQKIPKDFLGATGDKNLAVSAGNTSLIPSPGKFHIPLNN